MEVKFEEKDLKRLIYWIVCKFKEDEFHHQAASAKSDLIGGFFDRWFNRAPEFLIFRELLKDRGYDVAIDNFLYGQDTKKNAPDVIGLEKNDEIIVKFTVYQDGDWKKIDNMPLIEVKTFRKTQSLSAVGHTQMDSNNYYVFVESNVRDDYLITLFKESVFSKEIFESLKEYKEFIESDKNNQIIPLPQLKIEENLGFFKLLGIFRGDIVQKYSILVGVDENSKPEKPRYFSSVEKIEPIAHQMDENFSDTLYKEGIEYVPFYMKASNGSDIIIVKKLKGYIVIKINGNADINGNHVNDGYYKVIFKKFDRSSKKKEYIGDKIVFANIAENSQEELISKFDKLVKDVK
jgi:hypothetical protein|tara:strand:- start:1688 stop:2731 length:1044 start_codon:yes stop_codon:yes gene_type:complete